MQPPGFRFFTCLPCARAAGAQADPGFVRGGASGCPSVRQPLVPLSRAETGLGAVASCGLVWGPWHRVGWCNAGGPHVEASPLSTVPNPRQVRTGGRRQARGDARARVPGVPHSPIVTPTALLPPGALKCQCCICGGWEAGGEISLTARQHLLAAPGPMWIPCPTCGAALVVSSAREGSAPSLVEGLRELRKQQGRNKPGREGSCALRGADPSLRHARRP